MDFSPGKELAHTKMDVEALQEVLRLLQNENNRLRQLMQESQSEHTYRLREVIDSKSTLETKIAELKVEVEYHRSERGRLESELVEAVGERKRQAQTVQDVRRQVDGRLSKLMDELHRRDEEVHKLEYTVRERERALERLQNLELSMSAKDDAVMRKQEQIQALQAELNTTQQECSSVKTELRLLKERLPSSVTIHAQQAVSSEALAVFPLYRQWASTVEKSLAELDDALESIQDSVIDTDYYFQYGSENLAAHPDRKRLAALKKIDRDRLNGQLQATTQAVANTENDATVLAVQAIRISTDASRHTLGKCCSAASQLKDLVRSLQQRIASRPSPTSLNSAAVLADHKKNAIQSVHDSTLALESIKQETSVLHHTTQQLREALSGKEARCQELSQQLGDALSKLSKLEADLSVANHELMRRQSDCESVRKLLSTAEGESHRLREELQQIRSAQRSEREEHIATVRDAEQKFQSTLRSSQDESDRKMFALKREADEHTRRLETELASAKKEIAELMQRDERMRAALEESREKRLALKRYREDLLEETQQLRNTVALQSKDLASSQDMIKSLSMELERMKVALEMEVQHQEDKSVSVAADASLFREWKQQHVGGNTTSSRIHTSKVIITPGGSAGYGRLTGRR